MIYSLLLQRIPHATRAPFPHACQSPDARTVAASVGELGEMETNGAF